MPNPSNSGQPDPSYPPPSPAQIPERSQDPLPEPLGMPGSGSEDLPPANEPLGIPGGMPPEIVP